MIPVYYSNSYRDVQINKYFFKLLEAAGIGLRADQKSDVWCVAKLERYLHELTAFISVIPRRISKDGQPIYSPYIGLELSLARRVRLPRLLFVDDLILKQHRDDFPEDAVPFIYDAPASDRNLHVDSVNRLKKQVVEFPDKQPRAYKPRKAIVVVSDNTKQNAAAECVSDILNAETYNVIPKRGRALRNAYEDVRLFETLLDSELCVFLLGETLSWVNVMLAMAHAHTIPSIRLKRVRSTVKSEPTLHGLIQWNSVSALAEEFKRQLTGFRRGFVEPVKISSDAEEAARSMAKMQWEAPSDQHWDTTDGFALLSHLQPSYSFVEDEVSRVRQILGGSSFSQNQSRANSMKVCRQLYDGLKRHNFAYEIEPKLIERGRQVIRSPNDIETHECANCIDLACLFSSLLMAASQPPVIVVVDGTGFAHALVGYRAPDEPALSHKAGLGDLRGAVARSDLVLFEPTGAVESSMPVSIETEQERREAENKLHFMTAKKVAERLIHRKDITIRYVVDVEASRT